MQEEQLMTIKEVAGFLKLSRQTIYTLTKEGKLSALKIGGSVRYRMSDIKEYLDSAKQVSELVEEKQ